MCICVCVAFISSPKWFNTCLHLWGGHKHRDGQVFPASFPADFQKCICGRGERCVCLHLQCVWQIISAVHLHAVFFLLPSLNCKIKRGSFAQNFADSVTLWTHRNRMKKNRRPRWRRKKKRHFEIEISQSRKSRVRSGHRWNRTEKWKYTREFFGFSFFVSFP